VHVREAFAVVEEALRCMREFPGQSLAILTWTVGQRTLVQAALSRALAGDPEAARYRHRWAAGTEPLVVRQVDDAQGMVRDIVLVSFGLSEEGGVLEGTARLSGVSGARRRNVALSRARTGLRVFCSVVPTRIRVDHRTPRGLVLLRQLLSEAAEGAGAGDAFSGVCTSALEKTVERALESEGYECATRAGYGQARVDVALANPGKAPGFVCAISADFCSGETPEETGAEQWLLGSGLERLGWRVYRVWSSEWFRDPAGEAERLREFVADGV
jgi:hypothetical protein